MHPRDILSSAKSSSSCRAGGMDIPWPSLATFPYRSSPHACLLDNIPYPHVVAECMFVLVVLLLHGHVWGSARVHHLWVRPCFSSRVQPMSGSPNLNSFRDRRQVAVQLVSFWVLPAGLVQDCTQHSMCNCRLASSPAVLLESM